MLFGKTNINKQEASPKLCECVPHAWEWYKLHSFRDVISQAAFYCYLLFVLTQNINMLPKGYSLKDPIKI